MTILDIIEKKKIKQELSVEEINYFVEGFTKGEIPDYQASALLMAILLNGMTDGETFALTDAMLRSGDIVDMSSLGGTVVDKTFDGRHRRLDYACARAYSCLLRGVRRQDERQGLGIYRRNNRQVGKHTGLRHRAPGR